MGKKRVLFSLAFLFVMLLDLPIIAYSQSSLDGFDPNANNSVFSVAMQADGKILVGGDFSMIGEATRNRLARLNADGSLDLDFDPNVAGTVSSIVVQADGKILVGGTLYRIGGVTRYRIIRLNSNGSLDTDFDPNGSDASGWVRAIAVQADGKILIGGDFTTIGGVARNYLARLNPNGNLDPDFNVNIGIGGFVHSISLQADGKILIGGEFTDLGGVARNYLARLNPNGSVDTGFDAHADAFVYSIAVQADGKILAGGTFWHIGGATRYCLARLNSNGAADTDFDSSTYNPVDSIVLQADGKILIGGHFLSVGVVTRQYLARLNADGSLDGGFNPNANYYVFAMAVQADGKILAGGWFTLICGQARNRIARLNPDGSLDTDFNPDTGTYGPSSFAIQADGKILVGGFFTAIGEVPRNYIARLKPDGSLDPDFDPKASYAVTSIALQADGKILVGGYFTTIGEVPRNYIARLKPDGSLDPDFDPTGNGNVHCIVVQGDGKILLGGEFTTIGGATRGRIARLNPDGSLDPDFVPNAFDPNAENEGIYSIASQADGKVLVGGYFTTTGAITRKYLARLNPDGSLDPEFANAFDPSPEDMSVDLVALQADGKILVAGFALGTVDGGEGPEIARLNPDGSLDPDFTFDTSGTVTSLAVQADGKVLVGGFFQTIGGTGRYYIARLNPDGNVDPDFDPHAADGVYSIALQADGKILVGGQFVAVGGVERHGIARLTNTDAALQELRVSPNGSSVTWMRGHASPEVSMVAFEGSSDEVTWTTLGNGTRIAGGWQLTGLSFPFNETFYVRARGYNASGSLFESVRIFYRKPILGVDFDRDGQEDLVWRNPGTGRTTIWYMNGASWNGGYADVLPELAGTEWVIVGVADFNNDTNPDLLWRNTTNGRTTIWYMNGATWNGGYADVEPTVADPNWSIVGIADFNRDGSKDLLWRNSSTGRTTIWYMTGPTWNGGYADVEPTLADPNWSIVGIADFNRDGSPDLLWRDSSTGRTTIWHMTGPAWNGGYADVEPTVSDPDWQIVAIRDFNQDGYPDLLWRNTTTYRTTVWYMDGPVWNGNWGDLLPVVNDPNWIIVGR